MSKVTVTISPGSHTCAKDSFDCRVKLLKDFETLATFFKGKFELEKEQRLGPLPENEFFFLPSLPLSKVIEHGTSTYQLYCGDAGGDHENLVFLKLKIQNHTVFEVEVPATSSLKSFFNWWRENYAIIFKCFLADQYIKYDPSKSILEIDSIRCPDNKLVQAKKLMEHPINMHIANILTAAPKQWDFQRYFVGSNGMEQQVSLAGPGESTRVITWSKSMKPVKGHKAKKILVIRGLPFGVSSISSSISSSEIVKDEGSASSVVEKDEDISRKRPASETQNVTYPMKVSEKTGGKSPEEVSTTLDKAATSKSPPKASSKAAAEPPANASLKISDEPPAKKQRIEQEGDASVSKNSSGSKSGASESKSGSLSDSSSSMMGSDDEEYQKTRQAHAFARGASMAARKPNTLESDLKSSGNENGGDKKLGGIPTQNTSPELVCGNKGSLYKQNENLRSPGTSGTLAASSDENLSSAARERNSTEILRRNDSTDMLYGPSRSVSKENSRESSKDSVRNTSLGNIGSPNRAGQNATLDGTGFKSTGEAQSDGTGSTAQQNPTPIILNTNFRPTAGMEPRPATNGNQKHLSSSNIPFHTPAMHPHPSGERKPVYDPQKRIVDGDITRGMGKQQGVPGGVVIPNTTRQLHQMAAQGMDVSGMLRSGVTVDQMTQMNSIQSQMNGTKGPLNYRNPGVSGGGGIDGNLSYGLNVNNPRSQKAQIPVGNPNHPDHPMNPMNIARRKVAGGKVEKVARMFATDPFVLNSVMNISKAYANRHKPGSSNFPQIPDVKAHLTTLEVCKVKINKDILAKSGMGKILNDISKREGLPSTIRDQAKALVNFLREQAKREQEITNAAMQGQGNAQGGQETGPTPSSSSTKRTTGKAGQPNVAQQNLINMHMGKQNSYNSVLGTTTYQNSESARIYGKQLFGVTTSVSKGWVNLPSGQSVLSKAGSMSRTGPIVSRIPRVQNVNMLDVREDGTDANIPPSRTQVRLAEEAKRIVPKATQREQLRRNMNMTAYESGVNAGLYTTPMIDPGLGNLNPYEIQHDKPSTHEEIMSDMSKSLFSNKTKTPAGGPSRPGVPIDTSHLVTTTSLVAQGSQSVGGNTSVVSGNTSSHNSLVGENSTTNSTTPSTTSLGGASTTSGSRVINIQNQLAKVDDKGKITPEKRIQMVELLQKSGVEKKYAEEIELGIFVYLQQEHREQQRLNSYIENIKDCRARLKNNRNLANLINAKRIAAHHLHLMPAEFLLPPEEQLKRERQRAEIAKNAQYAEDMEGQKCRNMECPKCKNTDGVYSKTVQRGWHNDHGDPVTTYRCDHCDHRWKDDE